MHDVGISWLVGASRRKDFECGGFVMTYSMERLPLVATLLLASFIEDTRYSVCVHRDVRDEFLFVNRLYYVEASFLARDYIVRSGHDGGVNSA